MRALLSISAVALMAALSSPASAQMCGGGQTAASGSSGMCGGGMNAAAPAMGEQTQAKSPGCGCCQNMAMMQMPMGGQGAAGAQEPAPMMDMPSQGAPQSTPQQ